MRKGKPKKKAGILLYMLACIAMACLVYSSEKGYGIVVENQKRYALYQCLQQMLAGTATPVLIPSSAATPAVASDWATG